jgi:hypothetical protein
VLWSALVVIVGIGALYFALVQRRKPSHIEAPEGELLAHDAIAAATAVSS